MRAAVFSEPGAITVTEVPDPGIVDPGDAVVRVTHACVCGSDLWIYDGTQAHPAGGRCGHEWMGIVDAVGAEVTGLRPGDTVLAPFAVSDGTCERCRRGLHTSCDHVGFWGFGPYDGGQGEAVRAPWADRLLVRVPDEVAGDDDVLRSLLPLTDVMGTGHHAAVSAGVGPGASVVVVGDGAVGLCAVLASRRLGAGRVVVMGRRPARAALARRFGADEVVPERGAEGIERVRELTGGGAESVCECVGTADAMEAAIGAAAPGGTVGYVGLPHNEGRVDRWRMYMQNVGLRGGVAPVRAYIPELMDDVLAGRLDPAPVLDLEIPLADVDRGYRAMADREATKVMIRV